MAPGLKGRGLEKKQMIRGFGELGANIIIASLYRMETKTRLKLIEFSRDAKMLDSFDLLVKKPMGKLSGRQKPLGKGFISYETVVIGLSVVNICR